MKKSILRKIITLSLVAVTLCSTGFSAVGQFVGTDISVGAATDNNDFVYSVNDDNTLTLTYYTGNGRDVIVPAMIENKKVTKIDSDTFSNHTSLTSVTIPDTVTEIADFSFRYCYGLKNINVSPNNKHYLSDGGILFNKNQTVLLVCPINKRGTYTIPDGVTEIHTGAFENCEYLENIIIPNSVKEIGFGAFDCCSGLKSMIIPDGVEAIQGDTFRHCESMESLFIPDSVTSLDHWSFGGCLCLTIYGKKGSYIDTYLKEGNTFAYWDTKFVSTYSNISTISANEIVLGGTTTVNAKAVLGNEDYTYAVYYKKQTDTKWTTKQNFSTNDTVKIKPAKAVDYDICVKVKDSKGKIVKKYFTVKVNNKLENTSTISAATIKKGKTITVNGSATGGMGDYTYAVYYKQKSQTKWTTKQDFSYNEVVAVKPAQATDYDICIKVKDQNGTISKKYFDVTVTK